MIRHSRIYDLIYVGNLELLDLSGNKWDDQKAEVSLFEFQNSDRKIVIHSSSPTLDALYDGDP